MNGALLQDKISRGMGTAARRIGAAYTVYRPSGCGDPLAASHQVIRLQAAFSPGDAGFSANAGYGGLLWAGVFDSAYTIAGDYLVGTNSTFFIAAQRPLLSVQCVLTNAVLTISRPVRPVQGGYSGMVREAAQVIICGWPGRVQAERAIVHGAPPESRFGNWLGLLPVLPQTPQVADIVSDNMGRTFSVAATELSDLGWRVLMRHIAG